jgi:hypothetical protein
MKDLRENFEKFYEASRKDWEPVPFKEILWRFYCQGHNDLTPVGEEISQQEVAKMVDDQCFIDFINSCCVDGKAEEVIMPSSDFVEICYPCSAKDKEKCVAWPDRCEDVGGDGTLCRKIINLSKLVGVGSEKSVFIKDKDLVTDNEAKQLSEILASYFNQKDD